MNNQKVNFIPTYNGVPINDFRPTDRILLDVIDMPEANKAWSLHINASGGGNIAFYVGNSLDLEFVLYQTKDKEGVLRDRIEFNNVHIYSELEFNYRYMRIELATDSDIKLSMVK